MVPVSQADRAADRAFKRGQESNLLTQHIQEDARQFGEMKASFTAAAAEMYGLKGDLVSLRVAFAKFVTEAETRAEAAKERAEGALQAKQFYLGLTMAVITLLGILIGTGHA